MGQKVRIVFMGTPEFAVASLNAIRKENIDIAGVITSPDKPAGRGKKIQVSAVKQYALDNNIEPVIQPDNLKDEHFISELRKLNADLFIVVAFRMLPEIIWDMPKYGTINLHASLLPQYRGAAPINWAIINGESQTGVTTFFIEKEIDTGNIIMQETVEITSRDNAGTLHDKLKIVGSELIIKTIHSISDGVYISTPQNNLTINDKLLPAPKIFKEDCRINWSLTTRKVLNFIRGLSPYPAAWTEIHGENSKLLSIKIFDAEPIEEKAKTNPGDIDFSENSFKIACKNGYIRILSLQQAGKKKMSIEDFLRGFNEKNMYKSAT